MVRFEVKDEHIKMNVQDDEHTKMDVQDTDVVTVAGSRAKIGTVSLLASAWVGKDNLYSQIVEIDGVTKNSQVDITPSVEELVIFYEKDLTLTTANDGGIVTVYAIGQRPLNDYTLQVTITEVSV